MSVIYTTKCEEKQTFYQASAFCLLLLYYVSIMFVIFQNNGLNFLLFHLLCYLFLALLHKQ